MLRWPGLVPIFATVVLLAPACAQGKGVPTRIMIRAVARDAKLIWDGVGGARIEVRDAATGRLLAQGRQHGKSGSTRLIMKTPRPRYGRVFDTKDAAGFLATIPLERPTRVRISAHGPLAPAQATAAASKTLLLVPGEHVLGEGVVLEIHGFRVELLRSTGVQPGRRVRVHVKVTMACGCPTRPGGLWDSRRFRIIARLLRGGRAVANASLRFAGKTSHYRGELTAPARGDYLLRVLALDPETANFGRVERPIRVP